MIGQYTVDGVISEILRSDVEYGHDKLFLDKEMKQRGIPILELDVEYGECASGRMRTRVEAFLEMSGAIGTAASKAIGLVLFLVCLLYFSWRWPAIIAWPAAFVPASRRTQVGEMRRKMDKAVGGYFRTRLMIALIMGAMYAVGWGIAGVPYWLLVGMLAGLLGIIPYAATFAWMVAMLLRFLELEAGITGSGDALAVFLWPSLVFGIVRPRTIGC